MKYTNIQDLTVGQYQELYSIQTSKDDDIDKAVASVSVLTGLPRWEVEELPMPEFTRMAKEIAVLFSNPHIPVKPITAIKINGKRYKVVLDPKKLTAGQYIDVQSFLKEKEWIGNMHKVFASLLVSVKYYPLNIKGKYDGEHHADISAGVQACKFISVYSTCIFFLNLWNSSIKLIAEYLNQQMKKNRKKDKSLSQLTEMDLTKLMDGFLMPNR